jgi:hypothetical protein
MSIIRQSQAATRAARRVAQQLLRIFFAITRRRACTSRGAAERGAGHDKLWSAGAGRERAVCLGGS